MASYQKLKEEIATISIIKTITDVYEKIAFLKIHQQIEIISSVKRLTQFYERAAAEKIGEFKELVLSFRAFLSGVLTTYSKVQLAAAGQIKKIIGKGQGAKGKKTVLVFLSSNKGLYGELIFNIFKIFLKDLKETKADGVVIGKIGRMLLQGGGLESKIDYFDLDDDKPDWEIVKQITEKLISYEKIVVYYGHFVSVFTQEARSSNITASEIGQEKGPALEEKEEKKKYIFEPSAEEIYQFFKQEITAASFRQKIYESQLARYAARMIAMDEATQYAEKILKRLEKKKWRLERKEYNQEQLETVYRYRFLIGK